MGCVPVLFGSGTSENVLTTTISELTRKHASIAPTFLSAGTYWFSMPGVGVDPFQGTGLAIDDGGFRFGNSSLTNTCPNCGDVFFTLEGTSGSVPLPGTAALLLLGLASVRIWRAFS
jgi:hypothetical protein